MGYGGPDYRRMCIARLTVNNFVAHLNITIERDGFTGQRAIHGTYTSGMS